LIYRTTFWLVEHCVGPLGLGTLIVKPERHVTAVADLMAAEAAELGSLLHLASQVAQTIVDAEQVYNCLWSHAGGVPVHIHYVVQPVTREQMARFGSHGSGPARTKSRRSRTKRGACFRGSNNSRFSFVNDTV
jgi:diadenosine tetraphosphate (Ap4A) HIT family hydrolase